VRGNRPPSVPSWPARTGVHAVRVEHRLAEVLGADVEHAQRARLAASGSAVDDARARPSRRAGRRPGACRGCRSRRRARRPAGRGGEPPHDLGAERVVAQEQVCRCRRRGFSGLVLPPRRFVDDGPVAAAYRGAPSR
jgi:hypothetical protein